MIKFLKPKGKFAIAMYVIYEAALTMFPVNNDCQRLFQHNLKSDPPLLLSHTFGIQVNAHLRVGR